MAEFPALPLWTDAYLADTRHLSLREHGAYLLLMMEAWRRPRCALPDDDALLARLTCSTPEEWKEIKASVMAFWTFDARASEWTQKRLSKEHTYVRDKRRKNRDAAKSRWNKTKNDNAPASAAQSERNAPTPTPTPKKERDAKASPKKTPADVLSEVLGSALAAEVVAHRQRIRKPLTPKAATLLSNKFAKCRDPCAGAELMIERGWQGFEPEWMENTSRQNGSKADERWKSALDVGARFDERRAAQRDVAGGEGEGDVVPLLPARSYG